jgi:hypothetical protein
MLKQRQGQIGYPAFVSKKQDGGHTIVPFSLLSQELLIYDVLLVITEAAMTDNQAFYDATGDNEK